MQVQRLEKLLQLLSENEADTFILYALAMEYLGLNQKDLAEKYFLDCLQLDSNYIPAYYQLGLLYQSQDNEEKALATLQAGLQLLIGSKDQKTINEFRSLIEEISY